MEYYSKEYGNKNYMVHKSWTANNLYMSLKNFFFFFTKAFNLQDLFPFPCLTSLVRRTARATSLSPWPSPRPICKLILSKLFNMSHGSPHSLPLLANANGIISSSGVISGSPCVIPTVSRLLHWQLILPDISWTRGKLTPWENTGLQRSNPILTWRVLNLRVAWWANVVCWLVQEDWCFQLCWNNTSLISTRCNFRRLMDNTPVVLFFKQTSHPFCSMQMLNYL